MTNKYLPNRRERRVIHKKGRVNLFKSAAITMKGREPKQT